jgi:hypothetical protein
LGYKSGGIRGYHTGFTTPGLQDRLRVDGGRSLSGDATPLEIVNQAVSFASEIGYSDSDLALMKKLAEDLQAWNPSLEVPVP